VLVAVGALLAGVIGYRWLNNMTQTAKLVPGERVFAMPSGVVPRGTRPIIPKEQRDVAAKEPNPIKATESSLAVGRQHYQTF